MTNCFNELIICNAKFTFELFVSVALKRSILANLTNDTGNQMFQLAADLVNQSSRNIFLTGKAGTGKTTFLKYIKENCAKQLAVVAPTGVAAINAGGVTMHSFFQLPLSPYIPAVGTIRNRNDEVATRDSLLSRLRMTSEKKKVIQELELLIIDEISMVRCDVLDAVDIVLRHIRRKYHERFGGVQVLFIGDMFQLPPVVKDAEWSFLKEFYSGPYFFDSLVIREEPPVFIEFDKIYRQNEERFISILNRVRNNELDDEGLQLLENRYNPSFHNGSEDGHIILTTHNEKARIKNENELNKLDGSVFLFRAEKKGDFPITAHPADETLHLKVGAQVMFIKNDTEKGRRYFNGKIGIVTELDNEKIMVQCKGEAEAIEVKKETWENIRYTVEKSTHQLQEEVLGSFIQYPLRLAWSITIHKSQGLTFDKVIIDAGEAFAPGQVYVALSRCTTLKGIVLQSRIRPSGLFTDERIVSFLQRNASADMLANELRKAKKNYQLKIILSLFDYHNVDEEIKELGKYLRENKNSFNDEAVQWVDEMSLKINALQLTAAKFHDQIEQLFQQNDNPETNEKLVERLSMGVKYFANEQVGLLSFLQSTPVITDGRQHAKEMNEGLREIFVQLSRKQHLLAGFSGKFDTEAYHKRKRNFVSPSFSVNTYAGATKEQTESPHPVLHQRLRKLRDTICAKADLPIYIVAGSNTLNEMARYLPQSLIELRKLSGFGDARVEKYGQKFLDIILDYCKEKNLSSLVHERLPKRERRTTGTEKKIKGETGLVSFRLFKQGKTVDEIAMERKLTRQTIEGHLAYYVFRGDINLNELVSPEKIALIEPEISDLPGKSITPVKEKLSDDISYGEIRLVMAWLDGKKLNAPYKPSISEHHLG